jgi:hypothetical protein
MAKAEAVAAGLRPSYLFDQLVVGTHNQFAVGACQEVLRAPGEVYNPLFIYGPPGVGKTHLMQAVAHQVLQQNPESKIRYISAERFMSEVLIAISEDRMLEVRRAYSTLDLLILDDVQYLIESKISQEELFHVFNNMHQANKQVILASDRPPNQLTALNNNVRTRLEWGLATDVKVPDEATRFQILQRKQQQLPGLSMDEPMLIYVARALHSNVRELEGFLKRIHAYVTLSHQILTLNLVKTVVKEILPEGAADPVVDMNAPLKSPAPVAPTHVNGNGANKDTTPPEPIAPPPPAEPVREVIEAMPPAPLASASVKDEPVFNEKPAEPEPAAPAKPTPPEAMTFEVLLQSMDQPPASAAAQTKPPSVPAPAHFFDMESAPAPDQAAVANLSSTPMSNPSPELQVVVPSVAEPAPQPQPEPEPANDDENALGHKDIGAVFFYPEGGGEALESVYRKFLEVIKKHKLKFRLKRVHSEPYAYKGKINYSSFVDVCKQNKVPVAIVIGPPPENGLPQQDFYDLLTVTLDVQGVSLQLVNWSEINKDYRYLNLALDIALVRSR